jgi:hypothetical protein
VYKPPPAPPGKNYLPTHVAPEAYGKKKNETFAKIKQEVEERIAKVAAKKERCAQPVGCCRRVRPR